uniref:Protein lifeguard 2 n=1 Tax=Gongylonema pulchrum TaxID=637853 RepID=A0A183D0L6_9BILA
LQTHGRSVSPRRLPLFERASARWWNPQFASTALETQYWKCSFPQLRDRFRSGLLAAATLFLISLGMFLFTLFSIHYQRFYMPTSFLCIFILCTITLLIFSDTSGSFMSPVGNLATSFQVVLLIYTVIPLPLYLCILIGLAYSALFEMLAASSMDYADTP